MAYSYHTYMEKTTIYMSEVDKARLEIQAKREGRPQAELVRDAVHEYLTAREAGSLPACTGTFTGDVRVGAMEVKGWIRQHWRQRVGDDRQN